MEWMKKARCLYVPADYFFEPTLYREGVAVCRQCPVIEECAMYGLKEKEGVFGGMTPRERKFVARELLVFD